MPKDERPTMTAQFKHTQAAMRSILALTSKGQGLILTHGNGPQVGNILIRSELARGKAYDVPLSVAVAESEGEIGYVIQQALYNELRARRLSRPIITCLTQVLVDAGDAAFKRPTKPIGPFLPEEAARQLQREGVAVREEPPRGWRRVVASPRPVRIIEGQTVRRLAGLGVIVIAAGGGGIPVCERRGRLQGVDAVIDKDLASATLAKDVGAAELFILTDVPKAYLDFGSPRQRGLPRMTVREARDYLRAGHFPPGSMGPKVEAAAQFVERTGGRAVITSPGALNRALAGRDGTWVTVT